MEFLSPTPALIAAAITLPALLSLYFLRLRRRPVRVASTMFWPKAQDDAQANVPLQRLRWSWLLLLHVLVLACTLLAFAQPVIPDAVGPARRVIFMIDCSASMNAPDTSALALGAQRNSPTGSRTRLDAAKARAKQLSREALARRSGTVVATISFAHDASVLGVFTGSQQLQSNAIDQARPTDQPANLSRAIRAARALSAGAAQDDRTPGTGAPASDHAPPQIIIITDGSLATVPDTPAAPGPVRLELIAPTKDPQNEQPDAAAPCSNISVVRFAARRDKRDLSLARIFAEIHGTRPERSDVPLSLALDGVIAKRSIVTLMPDGSGAASASVSLELPGVREGVVTLSLDTQDATGGRDALRADDAVSCVFAPAQDLSIALVVRDADAPAPNAPVNWLLSDVLEELSPKPLRTLALADYESLAADAGAAMPDLLVFSGTAPAQRPRVPALYLGVAVPPTSAPGRPSAQAPREIQPLLTTSGVIVWDRDDPLLRGVTLDTLVIAQHLPSGAAPPGDADTQTIARAGDAPILVRFRYAGVEQAWLAFDPSQSNWPLTAGFPVFLANAAETLTARSVREVASQSNTVSPIMLTALRAGDTELTGPEQLRAVAREGEFPTGLNMGVAPRAGVYSASGPVRERVVCVNMLDEFESSLRVALPSLTITPPPQEGSLARKGSREIWPILLLAALALLCVEWVVYARQVRA